MMTVVEPVRDASPRRRVAPRAARLTSSERRTLAGVLGFILGLAALGPVTALAGTGLGLAMARLIDSR